ncbi:hypothetical protein O6H91_14G048600 [Diphasiastrum complanatum]|uniref:Uncharacterized protein n=1 Tax=Diphasiastrum complanatum TaxID=34168 RepID=A0ACC2BPW2_DIPCM|nr:hypothetical protein O6H91_14G048600 [Diphasiastrum complanatum]
MRCFYVPGSERRENDVGGRKSLWRRSWSVGSTFEGRISGSDRTSQTMSDTSYGSPGPNLLQSTSQRPHDLRVFTYAELKAATKNFFRGNFLGEGGFGCVYKGSIKHRKPDEGEVRMEVAVKQLNRKGLQGHKEWLAEVNFLGLVNHPNLVKLVGYCAEDDERGMQRLLVYEYMPNKSLEECLFYSFQPILSWSSRLHVALGSARGLAYLHEEMDFQIIFRDLKASNILLDNDFNPKLSDFGLARQGPAANDNHVTTVVVGTVGYAAPEYIQTGHLTSKSDVWSFGILLLELLTGRRAVDRNRPKCEQRLLAWVKPLIGDSKRFYQIVDTRLEGQYPLKAAQKMAFLASQCFQRNPRSRPKMSDVVEMLKHIVVLSDFGSPCYSMTLRSSEQKAEVLPRLLTSKDRIQSLRKRISSMSRENGRIVLRALSRPKMAQTCSSMLRSSYFNWLEPFLVGAMRLCNL